MTDIEVLFSLRITSFQLVCVVVISVVYHCHIVLSSPYKRNQNIEKLILVQTKDKRWKIVKNQI